MTLKDFNRRAWGERKWFQEKGRSIEMERETKKKVKINWLKRQKLSKKRNYEKV